MPGSVRLLGNSSACKDSSMMPDTGKIPHNDGATKLASGQGAVLVMSSDGERPGLLGDGTMTQDSLRPLISDPFR